MANYTSATNVAQFLQKTLNTNETSALTGYILDAVDTWIDRKLQSQFRNVVATTRYYEGGGRCVDLDPVQTVTRVAALNNDSTEAYLYDDQTLYILEPVNETVKRELRPRGSFRFPSGAKRVAVTGLFTEFDFANNIVPQDIVMAATRLAGGVLLAGRVAGQGNVAREVLEGHLVMYQVNANALGDLADSDPIIQGMLGERRELYLYDEDRRYDDDTDW